MTVLHPRQREEENAEMGHAYGKRPIFITTASIQPSPINTPNQSRMDLVLHPQFFINFIIVGAQSLTHKGFRLWDEQLCYSQSLGPKLSLFASLVFSQSDFCTIGQCADLFCCVRPAAAVQLEYLNAWCFSFTPLSHCASHIWSVSNRWYTECPGLCTS